MKSETMSAADTAWLRMERPTNSMCITGVLVFDRPLGYERLQEVIEKRLLQHDRFRQKVVQSVIPLTRPSWEPDASFALEAHLRRVTLPPPGDEAALRSFVGETIGKRLDFDRPLWELHLIERFGEGSALVSRIHHSLGDGAALVHCMLSLTDEDADGTPALQPEPEEQKKASGEGSSAVQAIARLRQATGALLHEGRELIDTARALDLAKVGLSGATAVGKLLLMPNDLDTPLKGKCGVLKRCAWSGPLPLPEVKAAGTKLTATINDVLISTMTGAIRRYLLAKGIKPKGTSIRAICPVNLRPKGKAPELGNYFGLVFLDLPVEIEDPEYRLSELKRRMDKLKQSPEAFLSMAALDAMGNATPMIQGPLIDAFTSKATAVMTNVPGPRQTLYLGGAPIKDMMFWVPQTGDIGLGVSILSYAGAVRLGVNTDAGLCPDPERMVAAFEEEFAALKDHLGPLH